MGPLLGAIADDFTGATDLASFMVGAGMRTIQIIGIPERETPLPDIDGVVIALKSRTQQTELAVADSLKALKYLIHQGCRQFYFKYCSTFDSTEKGNIGPVADALLDELGEGFTVACPALPVNGRTVYNGYLFVNGRLLNESGMENHPLTPMTDPDLVRFLGKQTKSKVGLVSINDIQAGADKIKNRFAEIRQTSRFCIVDAISDHDLLEIGRACRELKVVTGGSGLAPGLVDNFIHSGLLVPSADPSRLDQVPGEAIILSGSCSTATREQVTVYMEKFPSLQLDPIAILERRQTIEQIFTWFEANRDKGTVLMYATDEPESVLKVQQQIGTEKAGQAVESMFGAIAREARERGISKFVVAGGETSGAIVQALGITFLKIGPSIAPGVPLTQSLTAPPALLALKSGNFGDRFFFQKALDMMNRS